MPTLLTPIEARILGSMIEKSLTTPDYYPLTINAVTNACNQKSSRDPVMSLDEGTIARSLFSLREKGLAWQKSEPGNRSAKFGHHAELLVKESTPQEIGAITVLLLRGPQTPGEIKTRVGRLAEFSSPAEVELVLQNLANRPEGAYVTKLSRQPGHKEARYSHLFFGDVAIEPEAESPVIVHDSDDRVTLLEKRISELEIALGEMGEKVNRLAGERFFEERKTN